MANTKRYRDADGNIWAFDVDGFPLLRTATAWVDTEFITAQGVRHAYGPLTEITEDTE